LLFFFRKAVWTFFVCAAFLFLLRWHPRFRIGLLVLPLCGAAPTFLCSGKEK